MMRGLAEEFKASLPLPVLMQGEMGKSQLLKNLFPQAMRYLSRHKVFGKGWMSGEIHFLV